MQFHKTKVDLFLRTIGLHLSGAIETNLHPQENVLGVQCRCNYPLGIIFYLIFKFPLIFMKMQMR